MLGGVTVNLLLGIFIYSMILFVWGNRYVSNESLKNGVVCSGFAKELGFEDGDKLVSIDGQKVDVFYDISGETMSSAYLKMMISNDDEYSVIVAREVSDKEIIIGPNFIKHFLRSGKEPLFKPRSPVKISGFLENSNAEKAGLLKGDILLSIGGVETKDFEQLRFELQNHTSKTVAADVLRGGEELTIPVEVSSEGMIGFTTIPFNLDVSVETFSFISSIPAGYNLAINILRGYIDEFALIVNSDNDLGGELGGFGAIGSLFPSHWSWERFWWLTAFLSLILAFMNILPIPALDGGHVMFLLYEIVVGKPAPDKVMEYAQGVGMILLLGLLVYANGNDILKLF